MSCVLDRAHSVCDGDQYFCFISVSLNCGCEALEEIERQHQFNAKLVPQPGSVSFSKLSNSYYQGLRLLLMGHFWHLLGRCPFLFHAKDRIKGDLTPLIASNNKLSHMKIPNALRWTPATREKPTHRNSLELDSTVGVRLYCRLYVCNTVHSLPSAISSASSITEKLKGATARKHTTRKHTTTTQTDGVDNWRDRVDNTNWREHKLLEGSINWREGQYFDRDIFLFLTIASGHIQVQKHLY